MTIDYEKLYTQSGGRIKPAPFYLQPGAAGKEGTMRNWKNWLKCAGIRAGKTFAQTIVAMLPAAAMINEVDWACVLGTAALAAVASICTSLAGIPEEELE